ncbi:MAG: FKBP-type peptidyl-prolyl cis-trans isomerase [Bacteroidales bacterium]|nr:FKBP-type peptidyl-prolyl cis-trans isomerase [Bacteroidales bacterium]
MRRASLLVFSFYLLVSLAACGDRTPVIETGGQGGDPLKENMINANKIAAQAEATQINAYMQRHAWKATPLVCGAYLEVTAAGDGTLIASDDRVVVTYRLEALDGTPFYTRQVDTLTVGRREQTPALDEALLQMGRHAKGRLIVPSGAAYGVTGDGDRVGSRTVIIYHIEDINKQ